MQSYMSMTQYQQKVDPPKIYVGVTSVSNTSMNAVAFPSGNQSLISNISSPFTIEFFIKNNQDINNTAQGKFVFAIGNTSFQALDIRYGNRAINRLQLFDAASVNRYSTRGYDFAGNMVSSSKTSDWHHVAFVYNGSDANNFLYIDGVQLPNIYNQSVTDIPNTTSYGSWIANAGTYSINSRLAQTDLNMYILSNGPYFPSVNGTYTNDTKLVNTDGTPIYGLRVTKRRVYTGNFTVPTTPLLTTQSASTNISAITSGECVFCLESYKKGNVTVIRDLVQNIDLTTMLEVATNSNKP